jgi:hypothetical protein
MVEIAIAARYATTRTRFNILPLLNLDATGTTGARLFIGNDPPSYAGRPCAVSRPAGKLAGGDLAKYDLVHDRATLLEAPCDFVRSKPLADHANFSFAAVDALRIPFLKVALGRAAESVVSTELVPDGVFGWR